MEEKKIWMNGNDFHWHKLPNGINFFFPKERDVSMINKTIVIESPKSGNSIEFIYMQKSTETYNSNIEGYLSMLDEYLGKGKRQFHWWLPKDCSYFRIFMGV